MKNLIIIDAGVEHIFIKIFPEEKEILITNNDKTEKLFKENNIFKITANADVYITGKLADIVRDTLNKGEVIMPSSAIWSEAKHLIKNQNINSLGIIDLSASGYTILCIDKNGELKKDLLIANPKCGAGSGINLSRILEKLNIKRQEVDKILKDYLGEKGKEKRSEVNIRSDRCGVFSSSATISDKNQGIPIDYALAVTMKSEVLKACKKMLLKTDKVYLTGRIFKWQYMQDCAGDYLKSIGVKEIEFDKENLLLINGTKHLVERIGKENFRKQEKQKLRKEKKFNEYPSFKELKEKYEADGLYKRLPDPKIEDIDTNKLPGIPVNIGLDIGSTMAKMVIIDAKTNKLLFKNSYENHGDTVETIKHIFKDLKLKNIKSLNIQHIGITGSGRYQVKNVLKQVYPEISDRIFVLVENYAHAHGSIDYAKEHIKKLKNQHKDVNENFCVLVDIGGEDTKVSVISLKKEELFDNVMNLKCSAGTGSLMDTLKALFNIKSIEQACLKAYNSPKAYEINATCAVFLMENARKMQALGYNKDEILASCNYAIVENMARTLWNQIEFPKNAVVLLHGQTMLSDPLPLAATHRIQEDSNMYCLVPPLPGHRACIGLLKTLANKPIIKSKCVLDNLIDLKFKKKIFMCRGVACGDKNSCCTRIMLTSVGSGKKLVVTLGGCTAVNELSANKEKKEKIPNAYEDIWNFIDSKMPKSEKDNRLIIPRCFAVSEQAFFFANILKKLGIPVHVDTVKENDILEAQSLFNIDICAPLIGATGQFRRLAGEKHGIILAPQIELLPTEGISIGRTCTTNQGGPAIAMHYAKLKHASANFVLFNIKLEKIDPSYVSYQLYDKLKKVFDYYSIHPTKQELKQAIESAIQKQEKLKQGVSELTADYLEEAINNKSNISIVCAREYILNPGIYDSHVGKLLKDKGVIALPSYALYSSLDKDYSYIYWRNPHDILSKINAIANKSLHKIIKHPRLKKLFKKIETGLTDSLISTVEVSTFRCGPDTVTLPTAAEITKNKPSLLIQTDAMIKELAHLENRVNTYLNQLNKRLHDEFPSESFDIGIIESFGFDSLNKDTDVVYFPTLHDNRIVTSVFQGAGITTIDNFDDETYDLEKTIRLGRKYAGDSVCAPMAAVFGDILLAIEDFIERKKRNDPLVKGKKRILIFDNKGSGPCRQGQYYEQHKLFLYKKYGHSSKKDYIPNIQEDWLKLMVGHETEAFNVGLDQWVLLQCFQGIIIQAVLHSILLKGANCKDYGQYHGFYRDYKRLKEDIYHIQKTGLKPNKFVESIIKSMDKKTNLLSAPIKYFAYGLYNNNGFRKLLREFAKKWILPYEKSNKKKLKIHIEGEAYIRVAQTPEIFNSLIDSIGFNSFELTYSPLWCYLELLTEFGTIHCQHDIDMSLKELEDVKTNEQEKKLIAVIKEKKKFIRIFKSLLTVLRKLIAKPLYDAACVEIPHKMSGVLDKSKQIIPTGKPHGELLPYVGEAILKIEEGYDLFLNVAPEGCMVSSMGGTLAQPIINNLKNENMRIENLFTLNGEVNDEQLSLHLLKTLGPEKYYTKN